MRAAVEKVALAHSVITEFDSLTGGVTCNIEISTFQVRNPWQSDASCRLHAKRYSALSHTEGLWKLELKTLYVSLSNNTKTTNVCFNAL